MTEHERAEMIAEARVFAIAAPVILPLIERRRKIAYERLLGKFREGSTDLITLTAELNSLDQLERDIRSKEETFRILEDKYGKSSNK